MINNIPILKSLDEKHFLKVLSIKTVHLGKLLLQDMYDENKKVHKFIPFFYFLQFATFI